HATDVRRLALHVDRAHIDSAWHAESRARRRRRNTVLARAGFRDDAPRAELLRKQHLADRRVDFMRTRVRKVLALQPNVRTPLLRKPVSVRERRRPSYPRFELGVEDLEKLRIAQVTIDTALQPIERGNERLGHIAPAERTESAARVGICVF